VLVLQQGYIDDYSVTVVFRNKAQHAHPKGSFQYPLEGYTSCGAQANGLSPCQVLQRALGV